jgi:hypothetical protein
LSNLPYAIDYSVRISETFSVASFTVEDSRTLQRHLL